MPVLTIDICEKENMIHIPSWKNTGYHLTDMAVPSYSHGYPY